MRKCSHSLFALFFGVCVLCLCRMELCDERVKILKHTKEACRKSPIIYLIIQYEIHHIYLLHYSVRRIFILFSMYCIKCVLTHDQLAIQLADVYFSIFNAIVFEIRVSHSI